MTATRIRTSDLSPRTASRPAKSIAMPFGPPALLELPEPVLEAVIFWLGPKAARLRPVSRGCRDLVDASAREVGLLVCPDGQDLVSLLALLRKSTALQSLKLRWKIQLLQILPLPVAPVLAALWTVPHIVVRKGRMARGVVPGVVPRAQPNPTLPVPAHGLGPKNVRAWGAIMGEDLRGVGGWG